MKVSCLMATHGRYSMVCSALACFLDFDYPDRELVILNNCEVPLVFDHPLVRIINEPGHPSLGHCRQRLLDFADGDLCVTFDDDDLWTRWHLSTAVERIGDHNAWKPARSWWCNGPDKFELAANAMEASVTWRTDFVKKVGYRLAMGDEHAPLLEALGGEPAKEDMGWWASYCYRWGIGNTHTSATLGSGQSVSDRTEAWKAKNQDTGDGKPLEPANLLPWWRKIVRAMPPEMQHPWLLAALGKGPAHAPPLPVHPWRKRIPQGTIVCTPGCFDLLHPGHAEMLRWARSQGDYLAVFVNDDFGVAVQKGADRPLLPLKGRVASLLALDCVDAVIPYNGVDALPFMQQLRPQILVKGPEYAGKPVPHPTGCEVRIAPPGVYREHTSDWVRAA